MIRVLSLLALQRNLCRRRLNLENNNNNLSYRLRGLKALNLNFRHHTVKLKPLLSLKNTRTDVVICYTDIIFDFKIDFKLVQERIMNRSKQEQRSDDNIDVVKNRLDKYTKETYPVSQFFSQNFDQNFFTIDASQEVSKIQKELMNIIKKGQK